MFKHSRFPVELARKLGITAETCAAILGEGDHLRELIGELPAGALLAARVTQSTTLALYPVRSVREIEGAFEHAGARLPAGASLWIISPKQSGGLACDFTQNDVREIGLRCGFVDYKVCAVDRDWSGLKFARRKGS